MEYKSPRVLRAGTYVGTKTCYHTFEDIIASETVYEANLIADWHYHENPHFSHILDGGSKEIRSEGPELQRSGSCLYYYPGIAHQNIDYLAGTRIFNLEFTKDFFTKYGIGMPDESWMFQGGMQWNTNVLVCIMAEHYLNDQISGLSVHQLCLLLLGPATSRKGKTPEWVRKIKDVFYDCWNAPLSLTELSLALNVHPVTISRYFPHYFGCSAGDYLRRIKMEKALSMIRSTKHSLTEIAYCCGFADQAHFTKTCKRFTGITPKQYKGL